ncbi:uncharacterized protein LOC106136229 isoform X2 [Amyelois transitella]|uniref:uncharacterized protein LOC106136229 isoform X2 n=1 Tax=Amyelois transitella TaxID=680683 RepID=UPI00067E46F7|nr:uncharacterized protein LOC106136229 isoform X2 [Amyelois transitella]
MPSGIREFLKMSNKVEGVCVLFLLVSGLGVRADYGNDGGFMPSAGYRTEDQLAEPSARVDKTREEPERTQRFGISSFGSTGSGVQGGYGGSAPGLYGPVKIDLGGVLIGTILGFGAVIVLPKIIHALSYGYGGGYGRSLETDVSQISNMLNKLDETLSKYNIDSSACMQRLTCSYVQLANENMITGNATDFDALLSSMSSNSLIRRMLDGTTIYEAISAGRSMDTDCQVVYPKCKLDKKTVVKMLTQLLPS